MFEIGNSLREARLRRELELSDAEHGTKIRGKYLRALEDERFELLPAHTYVKGFLRSYADWLGLDGQLYVDEYNSRYVIGEEEAPVRARRVPAAKRRQADRRESRFVLVALMAIAVAAFLVIAAWQYGDPKKEGVRGLQEGAASTPAVPKPKPSGTARVEFRATRGNSYLIVRSNGALGPILYQGTLERGQRQRFQKNVLWVRLRAPANVLVRLNGNRVQLPTAVKKQGVFLTAKKIFAADPS